MSTIMKNIIPYIILVFVLAFSVVMLQPKREKYELKSILSKNKDQIVTNNINNLMKYISDQNYINEKRLGSKSYEYDFVDGEQPINGLGPSYDQNYPSTLPKENNMFVIPDKSVKYVNLLNRPRENSEPQLCIFVQLHNDKITPELLDQIDIIYKYINFDIYATVLTNKSFLFVRKEISKRKWKECVKRLDLFKENRGMDIGAFLWQLNEVCKMPHSYTSLLKLHTKTNDEWRREMILPFINENIVDYVQQMNNSNIGLMGASTRLFVNVEYEESKFLRDMEKDVFNRYSKDYERKFIAGSVFLANYKYMCEMMNEPELRKYIEYCYTRAPIGWSDGQIPHAFERFISYYLYMKNKNILGIDN